MPPLHRSLPADSVNLRTGVVNDFLRCIAEFRPRSLKDRNGITLLTFGPSGATVPLWPAAESQRSLSAHVDKLNWTGSPGMQL